MVKGERHSVRAGAGRIRLDENAEVRLGLGEGAPVLLPGAPAHMRSQSRAEWRRRAIHGRGHRGGCAWAWVRVSQCCDQPPRRTRCERRRRAGRDGGERGGVPGRQGAPRPGAARGGTAPARRARAAAARGLAVLRGGRRRGRPRGRPRGAAGLRAACRGRAPGAGATLLSKS